MGGAVSPTTVMAYELCRSCETRPTHGAGLTRIPAIRLPVGRCPPGAFDRLATDAFALQVVDGLLIRDLHVGGAIACELLGPSDVISTAQERGSLAAGGGWLAAAPTVVAALDSHVMTLMAELPELAAGLLSRAAEQTARGTRQRAIAQLPRVEDRVLGLLWLMAERWGRVTPNGTAVPISLTHETIGRLIGARRPTISLALKRLAAAGSLQRRDDGSWLLSAGSHMRLGPRRVHGPSEGTLLVGDMASSAPRAPRPPAHNIQVA